ncbi:MAG: GIY-YIG nuclease family protein [Phycisphaerae bacterium]|jgi:sugar fermentation stimulation protein A|nr:GIY-YIG nuclease family protein [Phycisphaerae bacterium]
MDSGIYIAIFRLDESREIRIGRLGAFTFDAGMWLYVGSAQRNLQARLDRHGRRGKKLRWHIDYLSTHADMLGAIVIPGDKRRECETASELGELHQRPIRNFGASDCRCGGHLFYMPELS